MARWWWNSVAETRVALVLVVALAAGCGKPDGGSEEVSSDGVAVGALPTPAGTGGGSVTGMPAGGPPRAAEPVPVPTEPVEAPLAEGPPPADPNAIPIDPATGLAMATPPPVAEPAPQADTAAAGTLVREYAAALGAGAFAASQQHWSATPTDSAVLQLARGGAFAADVLAPLRPADANADVVGVPVRVRGTDETGTERSLAVLYTVRRGPEGDWRIASANVREVAP